MIYLGRYQDAPRPTGDIAVITDPPYSDRTHDGQHDMVGGLDYTSWSPDDVSEAVGVWSSWDPWWIVALTDDVLIPAWRKAYRDAGMLDFAPVPVIHPDSVRLTGDGPASAAVYAMVARRRCKELASWGSLRGWYTASRARDGYRGAKSLDLMRRIVSDYSRIGWTVADPCCGTGTTLVAADMTRYVWGAEVSPEAHAIATRRLKNERAQGVLL